VAVGVCFGVRPVFGILLGRRLAAQYVRHSFLAKCTGSFSIPLREGHCSWSKWEELKVNSLFQEDKPLFGSWVNTASAIGAEIMSGCGFDFLVVDAEHSAVDIHQAQLMFQAIQAGNPNCQPMVRLPGNDYAQTKRYLDAGAMGVICPLVNSAADAKELVRSVKFPPLGERGVGYGRSHGYGFAFDEYMATANERIFVCVKIEHVRAVENIDEILRVEGVNAAFIGPYDLTASMGITGQFEHPDYLKAREDILAACRKHNVRAGVHVIKPKPDEVVERLKEGFSLIGYSLDITMIGEACRRGLEEIHSQLL
jgi:2-dehydro-3-deoxyglucarate aldolase